MFKTAGGNSHPAHSGAEFSSALLFLICFLILGFRWSTSRGTRCCGWRAASGSWTKDPRAADAIVMLGDDNYDADRATRAAELFKAGWAPRVIASGRYLRPYASIAELEEHDLIDRGVPPARRRAVRASRRKHARRGHGHQPTDFVAWLETNYRGHFEFPHPPVAVHLRASFSARDRRCA